MSIHTVTAYSIHLEKRFGRHAGRRQVLAPMPDGQDLLHLAATFIESLRGTLHRGEEDRYYGGVTRLAGRGRTIETQMVAGRGGVRSQIRLPGRDDEAESFSRTQDHIEEVAVRQLVVLPRDSLTGYWFFELAGHHTVARPYRRHFERWFEHRSSAQSLRVVFERVMTAEAWEQIENDPAARVEQVRIVHARAANDRSEEVGLGGVKGPYVEMWGDSKEPSGPSVLTQLRERILGRADDGRLVPAQDDVTEVTAVVRVAGRRRQVTVSRARLPGMRMVLDDRGSGPPPDDEFFGTARQWAMDLAERDDVPLPADWASGDWNPADVRTEDGALF
ncbi:hypothetical protein [Blastococcus xanthinilyticus]|uniref:Uncharacterized protein n=1 Tax=Blastococcus xanthinilyticus TaxID=1564164 RepID=A0A5S5CRR9_9ACTN|nr:hypothetical protein [Blastococcus xanthinilyticus]TYP82900.1 hypothetical protein BD833_11732 [Blastococcus xanthinilyticus]